MQIEARTDANATVKPDQLVHIQVDGHHHELAAANGRNPWHVEQIFLSAIQK
jgi:hypothetical protein